MRQEIRALYDQLNELFKQIMEMDPWEDGYGELVAIHENLLKVLRSKAQEDYNNFQKYLEDAASEIEKTWSSNRSHLSRWKSQLEPLFKSVERIIGNAVPLLKLL